MINLEELFCKEYGLPYKWFMERFDIIWYSLPDLEKAEEYNLFCDMVSISTKADSEGKKNYIDIGCYSNREIGKRKYHCMVGFNEIFKKVSADTSDMYFVTEKTIEAKIWLRGMINFLADLKQYPSFLLK